LKKKNFTQLNLGGLLMKNREAYLAYKKAKFEKQQAILKAHQELRNSITKLDLDSYLALKAKYHIPGKKSPSNGLHFFNRLDPNRVIVRKPKKQHPNRLVCVRHTQTGEVAKLRKGTFDEILWTYISKGEYKASLLRKPLKTTKKVVRIDSIRCLERKMVVVNEEIEYGVGSKLYKSELSPSDMEPDQIFYRVKGRIFKRLSTAYLEKKKHILKLRKELGQGWKEDFVTTIVFDPNIPAKDPITKLREDRPHTKFLDRPNPDKQDMRRHRETIRLNSLYHSKLRRDLRGGNKKKHSISRKQRRIKRVRIIQRRIKRNNIK
jgi:hypothetical protein